MGLAAYTSTNIEDKIDAQHPFTVTFDGRVGGSQEKCFYIRNDDAASYYTNIVVSLVGTNTYTWKLLDKDRIPIPEDWEGIGPGNNLSLSAAIGTSSVGDISSFLPVWVKVEIPSGLSIQMIDTMIIRLSFTRTLI